MKSHVQSYGNSMFESHVFHPQLMTHGNGTQECDGKYSHLMSSISTVVDDDDQHLLTTVLENFSVSGRDLTSYADYFSDDADNDYMRQSAFDPVEYNDSSTDINCNDSYSTASDVSSVKPSFKWSSAASNGCVGSDKAQLYERLFDSYIHLFNSGPSENKPAQWEDNRSGCYVPGSASWDAVDALTGFDSLSITERHNNAAVKNEDTRRMPTSPNVVDKSKSLWKRKRSKFKTLEKRSIPQLTGQDFQDAVEFLKRILDSLYQDQIPPTFFNVRSRFVEFDTKNIPVEHIMNICQRRQDIFRVETNEELNQTYIYFVKPPSYFKNWIDRNNLTDIYPESMWEQFLDFLVELVNNPDQTMPVFPGSIYGTAKVFQKLELPFFEGMTLGTLCHVVQLAVRVRKYLMYELKTLKPNLLSILQACIKRTK
ncbi:OST-HTH associated domain, putative [Babesia ovis]|uniref:OST-HTH associated domain, putative n=1 Tax=Babesia ovis TaxID=5869 RepID=A0A9W5TAJ3_BABOV|nr:OST-HTH associated domain, putative [Babesia ovis]